MPRRVDIAGFNRRARRIKLVLMDMDGVLTSGVLWHFVDTQTLPKPCAELPTSTGSTRRPCSTRPVDRGNRLSSLFMGDDIQDLPSAPGSFPWPTQRQPEVRAEAHWVTTEGKRRCPNCRVGAPRPGPVEGHLVS